MPCPGRRPSRTDSYLMTRQRARTHRWRLCWFRRFTRLRRSRPASPRRIPPCSKPVHPHMQLSLQVYGSSGSIPQLTHDVHDQIHVLGPVPPVDRRRPERHAPVVLRHPEEDPPVEDRLLPDPAIQVVQSILRRSPAGGSGSRRCSGSHPPIARDPAPRRPRRARCCARSRCVLDDRPVATSPVGAKGRPHGERPRPSRHLGSQEPPGRLRSERVGEIRRPRCEDRCLELDVSDESEPAVVRNVQPLVAVGDHRVGALDALDEVARTVRESGEETERAVHVEPCSVALRQVGHR